MTNPDFKDEKETRDNEDHWSARWLICDIDVPVGHCWWCGEKCKGTIYACKATYVVSISDSVDEAFKGDAIYCKECSDTVVNGYCYDCRPSEDVEKK